MKGMPAHLSREYGTVGHSFPKHAHCSTSMWRLGSASHCLLLLRRSESPGLAVLGQPVKSFSLFTHGSAQFRKAVPDGP